MIEQGSRIRFRSTGSEGIVVQAWTSRDIKLVDVKFDGDNDWETIRCREDQVELVPRAIEQLADAAVAAAGGDGVLEVTQAEHQAIVVALPDPWESLIRERMTPDMVGREIQIKVVKT